MKTKPKALGTTPRGNCPVCNYHFDDATDREFQHRKNYHVTMSVRHQKYLALQASETLTNPIAERRHGSNARSPRGIYADA